MAISRQAFRAGWQLLAVMWPARLANLSDQAIEQTMAAYMLALDDLDDRQWMDAVRLTLRSRTSGFFPVAAEIREAAGMGLDAASVARRQHDQATRSRLLELADEAERERRQLRPRTDD